MSEPFAANRIRLTLHALAVQIDLEKAKGLNFVIDIRRPPRHSTWECSIKFNGKAADLNADICLFLEDWADMQEELRSGAISKEKYEKWQDQTLAYYSSLKIDKEQ